MRVTVKVLRTIDKVGGLDEYLLGHKPARIKGLGPRGWALRWRLMQEPSVKERIRRERREMGIVDESEGDDMEEGAVKALRTSPEILAKKDYEKIVVDKSGKLLGTEPGRWRLLHVLYMRRLKEEKEIIAKLEAGAAGDGNDDSNAVAKEVREIDEALDAEDRMPDNDDDEDLDEQQEDYDGDVKDKKKKQKLSSSPADHSKDGNGKGMENKSLPWSQKQARKSKGSLKVHPELLEAAERGEQPRSSL